MLFFFKVSGHHRYLHLLTHSFPTRRSSDLFAAPDVEGVLRGLDAAAADASPPSGTRAESPRRPPMLAFLFSGQGRSEEHTSELQSLMRISYAVSCLKKTNNENINKYVYIICITYQDKNTRKYIIHHS